VLIELLGPNGGTPAAAGIHFPPTGYACDDLTVAQINALLAFYGLPLNPGGRMLRLRQLKSFLGARI
jgi:hypothetical protein